MNFVILDLEWNASYSKKDKRFYNEIIEYGAVKTDENLNIIDTFSMLIKPQIGKKLNSRIKELTHITNEELETSHNTFQKVSACFEEFLGDAVLLTWGTSDIHALMENYGYYNKDNHPSFLKYYCDLQLYCEFALDKHDKGKQMGLSTCAELLNIDSDELTLHRALTDAELSLLCFKKLYDGEKIKKYIRKCDDEFYRKITFRTCYITDINNPLIDKSEMNFDCPKCNHKAKRKTKWTVKNRSFRANFLCENCGHEFMGRIVYKLRYEGLKVNKRAIPIPPPKEKEEVSREVKSNKDYVTTRESQ